MASAIQFISTPSNRSMPAAAVIPVLHYQDVAGAAAWLCRVFGFSERLRIGTHRIQLQVGDGAVVVAQGPPPAETPAPPACSVMVRVDSADRLFRASKDAGADVLGEPASYPYGERQFSVIDIGGHVWTFSQTESDVDPAAWGGVMAR